MTQPHTDCLQEMCICLSNRPQIKMGSQNKRNPISEEIQIWIWIQVQTSHLVLKKTPKI